MCFDYFGFWAPITLPLKPTVYILSPELTQQPSCFRRHGPPLLDPGGCTVRALRTLNVMVPHAGENYT